MTGAPTGTWHHGLVAWWAEFNVGGPEIDYFGEFVERGAGRRLQRRQAAAGREQDAEALHRLRDCLELGGTLLLDNEQPYANTHRWPSWTSEGRSPLPKEWPAPGDQRRASDGSERQLRTRAVALDPVDQTLMLEIRAFKWVDGVEVAGEVHTLSMRMYFHSELTLLLERAGFSIETVHGDHRPEHATAANDFFAYVARRS